VNRQINHSVLIPFGALGAHVYMYEARPGKGRKDRHFQRIKLAGRGPRRRCYWKVGVERLDFGAAEKPPPNT
jgi:hypothetical protein